MLNSHDARTAIRLHERSFALIRWLRTNRRSDTLRFDVDHNGMQEVDAAVAWLEHNRDLLPADCRPDRSEARLFANMFASFGDTSDHSTWRLYQSSGCRCRFCTLAKNRFGYRARIDKRDKEHARLLKVTVLSDIAEEVGVPLLRGEIEALAGRGGRFGGALTWVTYGHELARRTRYERHRALYCVIRRGLVVLWREIAHDESGHVSSDFAVSAARVINAQTLLVRLLRAEVARMETQGSKDQ